MLQELLDYSFGEQRLPFFFALWDQAFRYNVISLSRYNEKFW